jgi:hypothetical protein
MVRYEQRTIRMITYASSGNEEVMMYRDGENTPQVAIARWADENLYVVVADVDPPVTTGQPDDRSQGALLEAEATSGQKPAGMWRGSHHKGGGQHEKDAWIEQLNGSQQVVTR